MPHAGVTKKDRQITDVLLKSLILQTYSKALETTTKLYYAIPQELINQIGCSASSKIRIRTG